MDDLTNDQSRFLFYTNQDGTINIDVVIQNESVWLTQQTIATLFGVGRPAITKYLKNIIDSGELQQDSVCSILEPTEICDNNDRLTEQKDET